MVNLQSFNAYVRTVLSKKDLIYYLIRSNLKLSTARTFFGYVWWFVDPLLYMGVYYLLVQVIFERGGPGYPAYLFIALIPWKWTISSIVDSTNAINSNAGIVKQLPIPKIIFPLNYVLVNTVRFLISTLMLVVFLLVYGTELKWHVVFFPVIVAVQLLFLLSLSLVFALLGTFFRDTKNMIQYVLRLLFYLSPGLYKIERVPESFQIFLYLNPITHFFMAYRDVLMYHRVPDFTGLLVIAVFSAVVFIAAMNKFRQLESEFAKVV